jgi:hypothetical protein
MSTFRVRALSIALAATLTGVFATLAFAGDVATFATDLEMRDSAPAFHGKVKSDSDLCIGDRKVNLYRRKRPGRPRHLLGTDYSNPQGRWAVLEDQFTLRSGIYFAIAPKTLDESTPLPTVCLRDKSNRVVVD